MVMVMADLWRAAHRPQLVHEHGLRRKTYKIQTISTNTTKSQESIHTNTYEHITLIALMIYT